MMKVLQNGMWHNDVFSIIKIKKQTFSIYQRMSCKVDKISHKLLAKRLMCSQNICCYSICCLNSFWYQHFWQYCIVDKYFLYFRAINGNWRKRKWGSFIPHICFLFQIWRWDGFMSFPCQWYTIYFEFDRRFWYLVFGNLFVLNLVVIMQEIPELVRYLLIIPVYL